MKMLLNLLILPILLAGAAPISPVLADTLTLFSSSQKLSNLNITSCSLNNVSPPLNKTTIALSAPETNGTLQYVALGRGTQNYSCAGATTPSAIGATATLFDVSCAAAADSNLLAELPVVAAKMPLDAAVLAALTVKRLTDSVLAGNNDQNNEIIVGQHFFVDATTPTFDFRPFGNQQWIESQKLESVSAPGSAVEGSVAWLKLGYKDGLGIHQVYRVLTAGGSAPATCDGHKGTFEVDYAAVYYFYT
ncbi:malate dehydrogenase [Talaromyces proteolyticus]|uniref:Malate dehydrogenase n=1 Tax=Talaromyces proteolyticus TaxID=1131652 RepID=A0AAD4L0R8_9EURO|nr:malate dehydrogenase [Talaromyces proteolyticus]KAH8700784.1 malate dehydrogenase [Talaromyces proteolyticus]